MKDEGGHDSQGDTVKPLGPQVHLVDDAAGRIIPGGRRNSAPGHCQIRPQVADRRGKETQNRQRDPSARRVPSSTRTKAKAPST